MLLYNMDCIKGMQEHVKESSIDLVFADPPFNIGYSYDSYYDKKSNKDYYKWCKKWLKEVKRVLKPNGTFWLMINDNNASYLDLYIRYGLGFTLRNWCIWYYTFGVQTKKNFTKSKVNLLYYVVNSKEFTFNAELIKVPSLRQLVYKDRRASVEGKNPDNVFCEKRIAGTHKERRNHPCQTPDSILKMIILSCSNEKDIVLDPFLGSGTTLSVCDKNNRICVGFEISERYFKEIVNGR